MAHSRTGVQLPPAPPLKERLSREKTNDLAFFLPLHYPLNPPQIRTHIARKFKTVFGMIVLSLDLPIMGCD
ncbi:hypothetical protein GCM10011369_32170 [Neiella marina]|uniref:Uncharacterized protein n=1 Tax=Neiella marina TaxID=508461 RepID=A0A8J2U9H9_9GAMM|nr:hypothetical protein GCM10011369_32170 [Neiella marina]